MPPSVCTRTLQGSAGGFPEYTSVLARRNMWGRGADSVCARGRRPLQAASSPVWVGHDDMMISFEYRKVVTSLSGLRFWFSLRANTCVYSGNRPSDFWGQYHLFRHLHLKRQHTAASMKLKVLSRMMIKKNKIKMIAVFGAPPSTLDYTKYRNEMARNGDF